MATSRRAVTGAPPRGVPPALPSFPSVLALPPLRPGEPGPSRPVRGGLIRARQSHDARAVAEAVERVRREYLAWPTLRLTFPQLRRLFGFSDNLCAAVLSSLLAPGFLVPGKDGQFCLADLERQPARPRDAS